MRLHLSKRPLLRHASALLLAVAFASAPARASDSDHDGIPDTVDALPCDPLASQVLYAPGKGAFGTLLFEDQWPNAGDFDFNDAAVAYNFVLELAPDGKLTAFQATFALLAVGASIHSGLSLHLPLPRGVALSATRTVTGGTGVTLQPLVGETDLVLEVYADGHALFGQQAGLINTIPSLASRAAPSVTLVVRFTQPQAVNVALAPFDLYLQRLGDPGFQLHLPQYAGTSTMKTSLFGPGADGSTANRHFVNASGTPFVLNAPALIAWPVEGVSIENAYPDILGFGSSGGTTNANWYATHTQARYQYAGSPTPAPGPISQWPAIDTSCIDVWRGTIEYGGAATTVPAGMTVDAAGNVWTTGYQVVGSSGLGFIAKTAPTGALAFLQSFGAQGAFTYGTAVTADGQGGVFVTGYTSAGFGGSAMQGGFNNQFVSRFDASGHLVWNKNFGASRGAFGSGVASDGANGVYAIGYVLGDFGGAPGSWPYQERAALLHLDANGATLLSKVYDLGMPFAVTFGLAVGLDSHGALVAVLGSYAGANDIVLLQLDKTSGAVLAQTSATNWSQFAQAAAVAPDGSAAWTGGTGGFFNLSAVVGRLAPGTGQVFAATLPSSGGYSLGYGVAVAGNGDVLATGWSNGTIGGQPLVGNGINAFLTRYSPAGQRLWLRTLGTSGQDLTGVDVGMDAAGDSYMSGWHSSTQGLPGAYGSGYAFVAKYAPDGTPR